MRVLVLGGTGFIGRHVVRALGEAGHDVASLQRGTRNPPPDAAKAVLTLRGDRAQTHDLRRAFSDFEPHAVIDMIGYVESSARVLVDALADGSSRVDFAPRVVCVSSGDVYRAYGRLHRREPGPLEPVPIDEKAPLRARLYPYQAETPRAADDPAKWLDQYDKIPIEQHLSRELGSRVCVVRLPMVYGPGDAQHRLGEAARRVHDGRDAIVMEERFAAWRSSWGYVENVADAIVLGATHETAAGGIYNVAEPVSRPLGEWYVEAARAIGWTGPLCSVPTDVAPPHLRRASDALELGQDFVLSSERIRRELGYVERFDRSEALGRTMTWELESCERPGSPVIDYAAEDTALARHPA